MPLFPLACLARIFNESRYGVTVIEDMGVFLILFDDVVEPNYHIEFSILLFQKYPFPVK